MTNDDVDRIEARLGVSLPSDYREFVIDYPTDLHADTYAHEIWNEPDPIIDATDRVRFGENPEVRWPHEMIIIGDSGCGDYYCLDLSQLPSPIVCWNHEISDFEHVASSIQNWYQEVKEMET